MLDDLRFKLLAVKEEGKRMVISFGYDFDATGLTNSLKSFDNIWCPFLSLLDKCASNRKGNFETRIILEAFLEDSEHWTIRLICNLVEDALVIRASEPIFLGPVIMIMANRKNTVMFQPVWLMHMQIQYD